MQFRAFVRWGVSSVLGHIVLFGVPTSVAFFALGLYLNYTEQTLTPEWIPHMALYAVLVGLAISLVLWYSWTRPLLKRVNRKL